MMNRYSTLIIGGGAAGMAAAISAARSGRGVALCERMPKLGKKVLASGGGRCNLSNEKLDESHYNETSRRLVGSVFAKFGKEEIKDFFEGIGLKIYSEGGRIFPVTNQSASVLAALEMELGRLAVPVRLNFEAARISVQGKGFAVASAAGETVESDSIIIAGGGKTYPALGSNGSCYAFARQFGHTIITPSPSAVPLAVQDTLCHALQGQKIFAKARSVIHGTVREEAAGELLFTKYGLSGTAVLDISRDISIALNRDRAKDVEVSVDMVPFMDREALKNELVKRIDTKAAAEEMLVGILPNKFGPALKRMLSTKDADRISARLKDRRFAITGTRGWNEAEFTSGGVDAGEVAMPTLGSKLKAGLYFAGEIMDVDGKRGGYNLAWAWASGFIAGGTG